MRACARSPRSPRNRCCSPRARAAGACTRWCASSRATSPEPRRGQGRPRARPRSSSAAMPSTSKSCARRARRSRARARPRRIARLELDAPNIRAAWQSFARAARRRARWTPRRPPWFEFLECRCFFAEGLARRRAVAARGGARAATRALTERARVMLGVFQRFAARQRKGARDARRAPCARSRRSTRPPSSRGHAPRSPSRCCCWAAWRRPRAQASRALEGARSAAATPRPSPRRAARKGLVALHSGQREAARDLERRALELAIATGKPSLRASAHNNLAHGREPPRQLRRRAGRLRERARAVARLAGHGEHRPRDAQPGRGRHAHGRPLHARWSATAPRSRSCARRATAT